MKSSGQGTPTGSVVFYIDGLQIGTADVTVVKNATVASFQVGSMAAGGHVLTAVYHGDSVFAGSGTAELSQCVGAACSTVPGNGKKK